MGNVLGSRRFLHIRMAVWRKMARKEKFNFLPKRFLARKKEDPFRGLLKEVMWLHSLSPVLEQNIELMKSRNKSAKERIKIIESQIKQGLDQKYNLAAHCDAPFLVEETVEIVASEEKCIFRKVRQHGDSKEVSQEESLAQILREPILPIAIADGDKVIEERSEFFLNTAATLFLREDESTTEVSSSTTQCELIPPKIAANETGDKVIEEISLNAEKPMPTEKKGVIQEETLPPTQREPFSTITGTIENQTGDKIIGKKSMFSMNADFSISPKKKDQDKNLANNLLKEVDEVAKGRENVNEELLEKIKNDLTKILLK